MLRTTAFSLTFRQCFFGQPYLLNYNFVKFFCHLSTKTDNCNNTINNGVSCSKVTLYLFGEDSHLEKNKYLPAEKIPTHFFNTEGGKKLSILDRFSKILPVLFYCQRNPWPCTPKGAIILWTRLSPNKCALIFTKSRVHPQTQTCLPGPVIICKPSPISRLS